MSVPVIQRTCNRTHKISIERLKGIRALDEVSLEDKPVTGIFGPNGNGKSTILFALAAAYQPPPGNTNGHQYQEFFPKLDQDVWDGTRFTITHSGKLSSGPEFTAAEVAYSKGSATTRWKPLKERRPIREVAYFGVRTCLPALELYAHHNLSLATYSQLTERQDTRALATMGRILNGNYETASEITLPDQPTRKYLSFDRTTDLGCKYSSVLMGAGEQRLFAMLRLIERTKKDSLILIDELDLLLHGDALAKLMKFLFEHCTDKNKQIVFTSHRSELLALSEWINIRHIYRSPARHQCFANTDPDSLLRLTGHQLKALEVFVEDRLAEAIVSRVASDLGVSRHLRIVRFGSATNCFTVLAGLLLNGETCDNSLFVLDGDIYRTPDERQGRINGACSGDDDQAIRHRATMASKIIDFALPSGTSPEPYLHSLICALDPASLETSEREIRQVASEIINPADRHHFIDRVVDSLGESREAQLQRVVSLAAHSPSWAGYIQPVHDWLNERVTTLRLSGTIS